jgi:putative IMPACT (imprinted ancient) family translation regulator
MLVVPYNLYEQAKKLIEQQGGKILDEEFAAEVTISIQFVVEKFEKFNAGIIELSRGQIKVEIIETKPDTLFEISSPSE